MIQVKDLKYKGKTISFKTPDTGLIFINDNTSFVFDVLNGNLKYDGTILVDGFDLKKKNLSKYKNSLVTFIDKDLNLFKDFNVYENIQFFLSLKNKKIDKEEIDKYLKLLKIDTVGFNHKDELFLGELQKVNVLISYLKDTPIIVIDNILENLDEHDTYDILSFLKEISKDKLILLMSNYEKGQATFGDKVIDLEEEKFELEKKPSPKLKSPHFSLIEAIRLVSKDIRNNIVSMKVFTVFLIINLILGIITSNLITFNYKTVHKDVVQKENIDEFILEKDSSLGYNTYHLMSNDEYLNLEIDSSKNKELFYDIKIDKLNFVEVDDFKTFQKEIEGRAPINNDEIVVSEYLAELIVKHLSEYKTKDELVKFEDTIDLSGNTLKVVGYTKDSLQEYIYLKSVLKSSALKRDKDAFNKFDKSYLTKSFIYLDKNTLDNLSLKPNQGISEKFYLEGVEILNFNFLNESIHIKNPKDTFIDKLKPKEVTLDEETFKKVFQTDDILKKFEKENPINRFLTLKLGDEVENVTFVGITPKGNYLNSKFIDQGKLQNKQLQFKYIKETDQKKRNKIVDEENPKDIMTPHIKRFMTNIRDKYLTLFTYFFGISTVLTLFMVIQKKGLFKNKNDLKEYIEILKNHGVGKVKIILAYFLEFLFSLIISLFISSLISYTLINVIFSYYSEKYYLNAFTMFSFNRANFILPMLMIIIYITIIMTNLIIKVNWKGKSKKNYETA